MLTYNTDSITIGDGIASVCLPGLAWLGLDVGVPSAALAFTVRCFSTLAQLECSRHNLEHAMCVSLCVCVCVCVIGFGIAIGYRDNFFAGSSS